MRKPISLADIERAHRLFSDETAMAILDALSHGKDVRGGAGLSVDQQTINDAVALLRKMELVEPPPEPTRVRTFSQSRSHRAAEGWSISWRTPPDRRRDLRHLPAARP